jgi:hypothetical protein
MDFPSYREGLAPLGQTSRVGSSDLACTNISYAEGPLSS